jgi:hypothetical protein
VRARQYELRFSAARRSALGEMLGARMSGRGARTAERLIANALEPSTYEAYGRHFGAFARYCEEEQRCALPAEPWTVIEYVGHLADEGTVAEGSLQPYLSAINRFHADLGHDRPAAGSHFLRAARQGMRRAQIAAGGTRDSRVPLPASAMLDVLADGERADASLGEQRESLGVELAALFGGRQDSCVHLLTADFGVDAAFIWLRLSEKGKRNTVVRRVVRLPLAQPPCHGHASALPRIAAAARRYLDARAALCAASGVAEPEWLLQLPSEARPTTRSMEGWLERALARCGVTAPVGFAYQGHSIRSGAVSAEAAIGVERHLYIWLGGWVRGSVTVERDYVDPTVLP